MSLLKPDQKPTVTDTVLFNLPTHVLDGCFGADPYMVNSVTIYFLDVNVVTSEHDKQYDQPIFNPIFRTAYEQSQKIACANPTEANLAAAADAKAKMELNKTTVPIYYSDATPVLTLGTSDYPAWLSSDPSHAFITHVTEDSMGQTQYGHFQYAWTPIGMDPGNYFICWTWTPYPAGQTLTAHTPFSLYGDQALTTAIPTHQTPPHKWETLFERWLPNMFKQFWTANDLTPEVLRGWNVVNAEMFTMLENLAVQLIDITDASVTPESILSILAQSFGVTLRSSDPTLWRRQIGQTIPQAKMKGTLKGLINALDMAGIQLQQFTRYWQVISPNTWQESFLIDQPDVGALCHLPLSKTPYMADTTNWELYFRSHKKTEWQQLPMDYIQVTQNPPTVIGCTANTKPGETLIIWLGDQMTPPIKLRDYDEIRIVYPIRQVLEQELETYIRTLPLMDERDSKQGVVQWKNPPDPLHKNEPCNFPNVMFPPKDWNTRLIAEDDPYFSLVVATRQPYFDPVTFGWIRTEFAYSENAYGMEEYDGSTRESQNPCDIGADFVSQCSSCQSSCFAVDVAMTNLSDDRILETKSIITDNTPFHAVLYLMNVSGAVNDFVLPPAESIECLASIDIEQFVLSGQGQMVFNRYMQPEFQLYRSSDGGQAITNYAPAQTITNETVTNVAGTGYSDMVVLFSPDANLIGVRTDPTLNFLEILGAETLTFQISPIDEHHAEIIDTFGHLTQPLNVSPFTFRLSTLERAASNVSITQDNYVTLSDGTLQFTFMNIQTSVTNPGFPWSVMLSTGTYQIADILPNGNLVLSDPSRTLSTSSQSSVSYTLYDHNNAVMATSIQGILHVTNRALVNVQVANPSIPSVPSVTNIGDYLFYGGNWFQVSDFVAGSPQQFYITGWTSGDVAGANVSLYRRIVDGATGSWSYQGLQLLTTKNYEVGLNIMNGANPPTVQLESNSFMENFLVLIGTDYYAISGISGNTITLVGPAQSWKTLSAGGQSVTFSIIQYTKIPFTVQPQEYPPTPGYEFNKYDRRGQEMITVDITQIESGTTVDSSLTASMLNTPKGGVVDTVTQQESIQVKIEWFDD